jgi:hypothetical protein
MIMMIIFIQQIDFGGAYFVGNIAFGLCVKKRQTNKIL